MAKIQEVPNANSGTDAEPLEQVQYDTDDNVFANNIQHFEQSESITNTCAMETGDSNVNPDSPDMCDNDIQDDQNNVECDDESVALPPPFLKFGNQHPQKETKKHKLTSKDYHPIVTIPLQPDFGGVTAVNVVGARETVGGPVVQQSGIQCFNCKEFGHYAKECRKPKRVKDSTYHKEKMLLCKQAEKAVPATENSPAVPEQTTVETVMNMTPENIAHFESEKEAIHLILTGIGDEIYSTVDACQTAQEMWEAIERLQQETIESYYTRFYKMMNEMISNNLTVATMQVNVQFLQQLQPEWSRFITIVKQQHKLDEVSYHKLFDILKQYQKEGNELHAERMAKNANPLTLVATAQKVKAYKISVVKEKHDELVKQSLLTKSHYEGLVKEKTKVITDLKLKEEKDIDKMISMENQLKFLNEIAYKRSQSI
ncbi:retrovirus-related pol polyprotein from transposon TNT 1-94 [Tanacetum coccineum]|uniref:Retrovirus-related pol polyprotein from transposon TNT 1-94 n=1 Tax=Tanacetum coccineum TaxID=301880 RepID=A0ABQ5BNV4_9ASTR